MFAKIKQKLFIHYYNITGKLVKQHTNSNLLSGRRYISNIIRTKNDDGELLFVKSLGLIQNGKKSIITTYIFLRSYVKKA